VLGVQDLLHSVAEISAFGVVVGELIEVAKLNSVHKVATLSVIGENPYFTEFSLETVIKADKVELVDWHCILTLSIAEGMFLLVIEFESIDELSGGDSCDFRFHIVLLILTFILIEKQILRGILAS